MTLPSIELRTAINLSRAIASLDTLAVNAYGQAMPVGPSHPADVRDAYVRWATNTEHELKMYMSATDAAALLDSPRHREIYSMTPGNQVLPLISAEVGVHVERLTQTAEQLKLAQRLFQGADICLVADTSFFIEHPQKIDEVDFHRLVGRQAATRVLVPMVVVEELDSLKRSKDHRGRASVTLAVFERVVTIPPQPGELHPAQTNPPRGAVTVQIVLDPPGRQRMAINDDEIVDRALACQRFVSDLTLITYDTNQAHRAKTVGLPVRKLTKDPEAGT